MNISSEVQKKISEIVYKSGQISPSELIAAAKPVSSPIHDAFEWNNTKAGKLFRLMQARTWIRKVTIVIEDRVEKLIHVPVLESLKITEGYYKPVSVIVQNDNEYELALREALSRLNAAEVAYDLLSRMSGSVIKIKQAKKGFSAIRRSLAA